VEGPIALDLVVHVAETAAEAVDRGLRDGPDHFAEKEHHGADVEELEAESFVSVSANCPRGVKGHTRALPEHRWWGGAVTRRYPENVTDGVSP